MPPGYRVCNGCGRNISQLVRTCIHCGEDQRGDADLPPPPRFGLAGNQVRPLQISNQKFCRECGGTMHQTAPLCPSCGARQGTRSVYRTGRGGGKSRFTAAALALLLGGVGVHKFYLGQVGLGILYLIFCWTLIPGIIAFVEFIIYLSMSDERFAQRYG